MPWRPSASLSLAWSFRFAYWVDYLRYLWRCLHKNEFHPAAFSIDIFSRVQVMKWFYISHFATLAGSVSRYHRIGIGNRSLKRDMCHAFRTMRIDGEHVLRCEKIAGQKVMVRLTWYRYYEMWHSLITYCLHHENPVANGKLANPDRSSMPWTLPPPPLLPFLGYWLRSLCSSMYGLRYPNDNRHMEHRGKGFLHCGQHDRTGFWRLSQELAIPSCRLSFERGNDALQ